MTLTCLVSFGHGKNVCRRERFPGTLLVRLWSVPVILGGHIYRPNWVSTENFTIEWSSPDRYELIERIGGGRYSEVRRPFSLLRLVVHTALKRGPQVFKGIDMVNSEISIIKVLKPVAPKKIKREVKVLRNLTGGANIVALRDVVQDPSGRYHSLIMEYVDNVDWKSLFPVLNELDIKYYTFQLLKVRPRFVPSARFPAHEMFTRSSFWSGPGLCALERDYAPRRETGECHDRSSTPQGRFFYQCGVILCFDSTLRARS